MKAPVLMMYPLSPFATPLLMMSPLSVGK